MLPAAAWVRTKSSDLVFGNSFAIYLLCEKALFSQSTRLSSRVWIAGVATVRGNLMRRCVLWKWKRREVRRQWLRMKHDL